MSVKKNTKGEDEMSRVIYRTRPFSPYAKYSKYWNEYIQEGDEIIKYVYNKVKFPDRELRNEIYSDEKQRWTIGDINLPDWLYRFVVADDLSDNGKKIVKQWRLEKYSSELNDYKEKGYFIDEEKKIVITDREILMFREDSEVPYWDTITSLVKNAYNRVRITPKMMELVKKDFETQTVDYKTLCEMAEQNRKKNEEKEKEILAKQQELQEKKDYEVATQLFLRLQKNLVDIKTQLSEEGRKEVDALLNLIDDSEVCRANYDILHQAGVEIILKEKSKRG